MIQDKFEFSTEITVSQLENFVKTVDRDNKTYINLSVVGGSPFLANTEIFGEDTPGDRCIITETEGIFLEYDTADITEEMELIEDPDIQAYLLIVVDDPVEQEEGA